LHFKVIKMKINCKKTQYKIISNHFRHMAAQTKALERIAIAIEKEHEIRSAEWSVDLNSAVKVRPSTYRWFEDDEGMIR